MRRTISWLTALLCLAALLRADDTESVRVADSFGLPVGIENGKRYYKARGFRPNGHLGEDWNGIGGGNTDLGDPVHATANGLVVYAQDFRAGWGNVVIVRHAYYERGDLRFVDSLYGHLARIAVREGQRVERGAQVGTIGTAHGRYPAHLHFEIRKDIRVGMYRSMFTRDFGTYHDPTQFIITHQSLSGENRTADVPVNTFPNQTNTRYVSSQPTVAPPGSARPAGIRWSVQNATAMVGNSADKKPKDSSAGGKKGKFYIDRYGDMRRR